jgi:chromosomal replication initiator protein
MATDTIWDHILHLIEGKVGPHSYSTWFKPTQLKHDHGHQLTVIVPAPLFTEWLPRHYSSVLNEALEEAGRAQTTVCFEVGLPTTAPEPEVFTLHTPPAATPDASLSTLEPPLGDQVPAPLSNGLNPRYTFDTFIVGPSNQFAHAAARAVAEAPSRSYNPLFIYGGVGLGKTHLMHAIGHYVVRHTPGLTLSYISSERFMNEMINALRFDRILDFRAQYRSVDILLVDDIQFVSGKEGTQMEFFHTFNALHDAQKQLVISSDRPPHEIPALEERLRSRFEWGLIADIQTPDIETKIAILKRKAETEAVPLPDSVAMFIANRIKSNIRELEGSLTRLVAYASLKGLPLTIDLAQDVLRNTLDLDDRAVTIEQIQRFVADYYQLRLADLKSRNNAKSVAMPRQVAMYLSKSLTTASLPEIGRAFGGKHHSTVIHSIKKVEDLRRTRPEFDALMGNFLTTIK